MWKCHAIYESRPHSVIVTLGGQLYRVPEVVLTTILEKQCRKVISHTTKFSLFMIQSEGEQKDTATTIASTQDVSIQQKQVDKIVEEHEQNEILPYVQHSSIGHDPFQVCLGFPPVAPIDISLLVASSSTESSHTQTKEDHAARSIEWIQHLQQVHDILPQEKYKQDIYFNKESNSPRFRFNRSFPISRGNLMQWGPLLPKGGGMIQVDLGGHPPFPLNQHFEPMVLINHDIHPFDGEWNVIHLHLLITDIM
jgi:hypothetical protein